MEIPANPLELKADADPLEASFDVILQAEEHEERIAALETGLDGIKGDVDATRAESETMRERIERLARSGSRPSLGGGEDKAPETKSFVDQYLRRGLEVGVKSFSATTGPDGGFAVPREIDALIARTLADISPIRSIAQVVQTGTAGYRKLVTTGGTPSGWVSETAARPETDTPAFAEIAPPSGELYANPAASQAMLDDAAFDVESWLAGEIAEEFARAEGAAFVGGNGTNRPRGFLNGTPTPQDDTARAFGTLQYVASGADGNFASAAPEDRLVDLVHALRPAYRQGASFVMNSSTLARIRKMKSDDGAFLWQPSLAAGQPATLLGYPVVEAEDMPDIGANSLSIAFGNFRAGYLIAERSATTILRDPFTNKPFVHFYATKRIGGQVMNSEAIKLMKFAAS